MNPQREKVLQQLTNAMNEGLDSETFYQVMRQALRLRPAPRDLLVEALLRHRAAKKVKPSMTPDKERWLREAMSHSYGPSQRAQDPNHAVGSAAQTIRAVLSEFQPWQIDISQVDFSQLTRHMLEDREQAFSFQFPPGFTERSTGSYISAKQAWLVKDQDGSVLTTYELMQRKATRGTLNAQMKQGSYLSDILWLLWKRSEAIELRAVEEQLRRLWKVIVPETPARFSYYDEPRYRAALRMELGDNPIPAAIGGVLNPWPGLSDQVSVASVVIYLEPWGAALSGEVVELVDFPRFLFEDNRGNKV